ncbi:unnamed protein product, partial [Symbiodinium necroappetens]
ESNLIAVNAAATACEKAAEWRWALRGMHGLREAGLRPDSITCNAFLAACGNASLWEQPIALLRETRTDIVSHNCAIKACDTLEQWQRALSLLADLPSALEGRKLADAVTHTVAISASQKQTRWQSGLFIWDIEHGREATVTTCNSALAGCADAARWQEAVYFTCGLALAANGNMYLSSCVKFGSGQCDWDERDNLIEHLAQFAGGAA